MPGRPSARFLFCFNGLGLTRVGFCSIVTAMTKSELIARLAARNPHLYQRDVERIVATVFDEISKALAGGHRVELRGFGAFSVKKRDPRTGRNPRTGEQVAVASKRVPYFKTGKDLRDRLNKEAQRAAGLAPAARTRRRQEVGAGDRPC